MLVFEGLMQNRSYESKRKEGGKRENEEAKDAKNDKASGHSIGAKEKLNA